MVRIAIVLGLLLIPALATGDELELSLGSSVEYDSNVFRQQNNEKQDAIFRILPTAALYRDRGDFQYRLSFATPFEQGVETANSVSDVDYVGNLESSWIVNEATEFFLLDRFRYDRSVTRRFQQDQEVPDVSNRRARVLSNTVTLGMNHALTPRTTTGATFSNTIFDTKQQGRQDNRTYALTTDINHALTTRNQVGTGFSFVVQDFDSAGGIPSSETYYYNLFGSWVFRFDETTSFSVSGGPTIIQLDQQAPATAGIVQLNPTVTSGGDVFVFLFDTMECDNVNGHTVLSGCDTQPPPFPPDTNTMEFDIQNNPGNTSDVSVTGFGRALLSKRWTPAVVSALSYRRQQSTASGLGGSTIIDAATASTSWEIDRWWDASLRVDYAHRESVGKSTQTFVIIEPDPMDNSVALATGLTATRIKNSIETDNIGVAGRLVRQIGRNAEASMRISYNKQFSKSGTRGSASDYDVILAIFGFRYRFEPITVW